MRVRVRVRIRSVRLACGRSVRALRPRLVRVRVRVGVREDDAACLEGRQGGGLLRDRAEGARGRDLAEIEGARARDPAEIEGAARRELRREVGARTTCGA